jgi:hypothetical protein
MMAVLLRALVSRVLLCAALVCVCNQQISAQSVRTAAQARAVAIAFAPIFYQGLGDTPRRDYITNFNFDGDWRGDNNWTHTDDKRFPLRAYIYYAVSETETHLFIHYAVFHPQDYKGGETGGRILSDVINEGLKHGGRYDPTGLAVEATVAHENDMEGCLVVVAKQGNDVTRARVVYVETLAHNRFLKYVPEGTTVEGVNAEPISLEDNHPRLYVEPKGHGIEAYQADEKRSHKLLRYTYGGRADAPTESAEAVSYDLLSLQTDLWLRAHKGVNETYGVTTDYGRVTVSVAQAKGRAQERQVALGKIGSAFLGTVGGHNMAKPPWGWVDIKDRETQGGTWFFDPARTVKRHFKLGDEFSVAYTWQPFLGVGATR